MYSQRHGSHGALIGLTVPMYLGFFLTGNLRDRLSLEPFAMSIV